MAVGQEGLLLSLLGFENFDSDFQGGKENLTRVVGVVVVVRVPGPMQWRKEEDCWHPN